MILEDVFLVPAKRLLLPDLLRVPLDQLADGQVSRLTARRRHPGASCVDVGFDAPRPLFRKDLLRKSLGLDRVTLAAHLRAPRVPDRDNAGHAVPLLYYLAGLTVANP